MTPFSEAPGDWEWSARIDGANLQSLGRLCTDKNENSYVTCITAASNLSTNPISLYDTDNVARVGTLSYPFNSQSIVHGKIDSDGFWQWGMRVYGIIQL